MAKKFLFVCLLLSGCAGEVRVRDHLACGDLGKFGASCVHTLYTKRPPVRLDKATWDAKRIGWICFDAPDVADMQKTIDILCTRYKKCNYDKEAVGKFIAFMMKTRTNAMLAGVRVSDYLDRMSAEELGEL